MWVSGTSYANNALAVDPTNNQYYQANNAITNDTVQPSLDSTNWSLNNYYCDAYDVDWNNSISSHPIIRPQLMGGPDWGSGGSHPLHTNLNYGGSTYWAHQWNQPQCNTYSSTVPCDYPGAPNPSLQMLTASLPSDAHPTYRQVGATDTWPMFMPTSAVPNWSNATETMPCTASVQTGCTNYTAAGYGEIVAFQVYSSNPTMWRFGHNFATGSVYSFSVQNTMGVISQDGLILGYGSDFMGTRGDSVLSNTATCQCSNGTTAESCGSASQSISGGGYIHAMYQWLKGAAVTVGDKLMNISTNDIYQATAVTGTATSGSAKPSFCTSAVGCTTTETSYPGPGSVTWTLLGQNSCRGDIALMALPTAQPAP